jgi:hypothetical protein
MQAIVEDTYGSAGVLELSEIERPEIGESSSGESTSSPRRLAAIAGGNVTSSPKAPLRVIGATWLLGFVTYAVGVGLATSVLSTPDSISTILAHQTILALGGFLLLVTCVLELGKAVLFFPILEPYSKRIALTYLSALTVEVVLVAVGALGILMVVPLSRQGVDAGAASAIGAKALGSIAIQWNTMAYQIGEMSLCIGGAFLSLLLLRTRLIPRPLAVWGLVGYAIFMAGLTAEIFGIHISLILSGPGGLFEIVFACWLLFKGFRQVAPGQDRAPMAAVGQATVAA